MAECIQEQYIADALGLTPLEVRRLSFDDAQAYLGYLEGKRLAEFVAQEQQQKEMKRRG